jgi:hypothetical protein
MDKLYLGNFNEKHLKDFSVVQFHCELKDEYYHRIGCKVEDDAMHSAPKSNLSVTKRTSLPIVS